MNKVKRIRQREIAKLEQYQGRHVTVGYGLGTNPVGTLSSGTLTHLTDDAIRLRTLFGDEYMLPLRGRGSVKRVVLYKPDSRA